jgi:pimeloyl-ACP methyl ester carboxylesterase
LSVQGDVEGVEMPKVQVDRVKLWYEIAGGESDDPVVLVHGSWVDHRAWQQVVPRLAQSFRVLTYDRRGHGQSECRPGQGTRQQDETDLAGLLEALKLAPAHLAGNSFGASIILGMASRRPDLCRSVIIHEPPLSAVIANDVDMQPMLRNLQTKIDAVLRRLESGDVEGGSRQFVEEVAIGPGAWELLPAEVRQTFIDHALTFVDEQRDARWAESDVAGLSQLPCPVLFTQGDQSFPWFPRIIDKLQAVVPGARVHTFEGAGHLPHFTHSEGYARVTTEFIDAVRGMGPSR